MDIRFSRELDGSYVTVTEAGRGDAFTERMLEAVHPQRLLPLKMTAGGDATEYCYEISGLKSLEAMLTTREISGEELRRLFKSIYRIANDLEEFLLEPSRLWLEPGLMFCGRDGWHFCLHPARNVNLYDQLQLLSRFLLKKADRGDETTSRMAYELFRVCHEDNCCFAQIWEALEMEESPAPSEEEPAAPEEAPKRHGLGWLFGRRG